MLSTFLSRTRGSAEPLVQRLFQSASYPKNSPRAVSSHIPRFVKHNKTFRYIRFYSAGKDFKNPFNFDTTDRHYKGEEGESLKEFNSIEDVSAKDQLTPADITAQTSNVDEKAAPGSGKTFKKKSRVSPTASEQSARSAYRTGLFVLLGISGLGLYNFYSEYSTFELSEYPDFSKEDAATVRAKKRYLAWKDYFFRPKYTALLPPQQAPPGHSMLTLVINLDDTLIKIMWDREHGYRVAKRPGLDRFLGLLFQFYEVVIFTSQNEFTARPLLDKLDPYHMYHHYLLTKDNTTRIDGKTVKDLSLLNRDLSQVVIMDSNPEHYSLQVENSIQVPAWDGNSDDRYLLDILPFLESLVISNTKDVRPVLTKYRGKDIPKELREYELAQQIELSQKQNSGLRRLLGVVNSSEGSLPLTPIMARRRELEMQYDSQKENIKREHKEYVENMLEQEKKLMSETKMTGWNVILRNFAPPPDSPDAAAAAQANPSK